jgi:pimeloyl-ACP methyl ester carboxylesterase
MRRGPILAALVLAWIPGLALAAEPAAPPPKLALGPCTDVPGVPPEARCGTYEVWENRTTKSGRKIPLRVLVIPALGPDRLPDPIVLFGGGPGESSVALAPDVLEMFKPLRQRRDILLVDFRGTGGSAGLFCPEMQGTAGLQGALDSYLPPDKVKACGERLAKTADLSQYTNDTSVDDVDEVRAALGYGKLNLYGGSGGTRSALVYLRRHPESLRTVILAGVVPPDERGPFYMARHAQRALDGLIAECKADAACHGAFPRLREEVATVLETTDKESAVVTLTDVETGKPVEIRLNRGGVAQTLRYMLYRPQTASLLPLAVHLAAQGNWKPLAQSGASFFAGGNLPGIADGYYLSLTCSEDVPFIREDEIPAIVQGTFLGDFRIRKQQAACAAWPVPPVDRKFLEPVVADVPTLLLSGERDPAGEVQGFEPASPSQLFPVIRVGKPGVLPKLDQAWAWAHVQLVGDEPASPEALRDLIVREPHRAVARLLCPRRLEPRTTYLCCLVPTFERGRLAGLQDKIDPTLDGLKPAWTGGEGEGLRLPVYYHGASRPVAKGISNRWCAGSSPGWSCPKLWACATWTSAIPVPASLLRPRTPVRWLSKER